MTKIWGKNLGENSKYNSLLKNCINCPKNILKFLVICSIYFYEVLAYMFYLVIGAGLLTYNVNVS